MKTSPLLVIASIASGVSANVHAQLLPTRQIERRSASPAPAGMAVGQPRGASTGEQVPHVDPKLQGADSINWLPAGLSPEARLPIEQAKPGMARLQELREDDWFDYIIDHHNGQAQSQAFLRRYQERTREQEEIAQQVAQLALRNHRGPVPPPRSGFHVDPALHGHRYFRKLPPDLHPEARLVAGSAASRMRSLQWERLDGPHSLDSERRANWFIPHIGARDHARWAANGMKQDYVARQGADAALRLHRKLTREESARKQQQQQALAIENGSSGAGARPNIKPSQKAQLKLEGKKEGGPLHITHPSSDEPRVEEPLE